MRDILIRARELIADPANWIQGSYSEGSIIDPETKCFCAIGAVDRAVIEKRGWLDKFSDDNFAVAEAESDPEGSAAIEHLQQFVPGLASDFNDDHTHAEVLGLFDKAIANA